MAKLGKQDVKHVARLARLKLTSKEVGKFQKQLGEVLEHMKDLEEVDVSGVEPTSQTTGLTNVMRKDGVDPTRSLSQMGALSGTEKTDNGYFVVEALIDKTVAK